VATGEEDGVIELRLIDGVKLHSLLQHQLGLICKVGEGGHKVRKGGVWGCLCVCVGGDWVRGYALVWRGGRRFGRGVVLEVGVGAGPSGGGKGREGQVRVATRVGIDTPPVLPLVRYLAGLSKLSWCATPNSHTDSPA